MNLQLFNNLMEEGSLLQSVHEWQMFLTVCDSHLRKHGIKNPTVVELGVWRNKQKRFYKQLLGAEHIGIDISNKRSEPDILGDTNNSKTLEKLKEKLQGKPINILFIDAGHDYKSVKKDFEMYSPLCSDIIAIHDIENRRETVRKFWGELKEKSYLQTGEHRYYMFLSIYQIRLTKRPRQLGIGVVIKR